MISLPSTLEALLFASGEAITKKRVCALLEVPQEMLTAAISELRGTLSDRGLSLIETDDELELRTSADAAPIVKKLRESELSRDIGKAGLEALAIVLYQGGATRGEIDYIRGVNSGTAIRSLLLRGLIERGEDATDKRRARYTTTIDALAHLGITKKENLPRYSEFAQALTAHHETTAQPSTQAE
jgi:segregation and condensation protein B